MSERPSQEEIDAIGYFVEAIRELKSSAFFLEEHRALSITPEDELEKDATRARFPDPQVLRAALVPFRRVWHQGEPCFHERVGNILMRYVPANRILLPPLLFRIEDSLVANWEWLNPLRLKPKDIVDLWLNTRYHHVGKADAGRFTRQDFDDYSKRIGPVRFEFSFLFAVHEYGISFFNMMLRGEDYLQTLVAGGLSPSFRAMADEAPGIERRTPGYTPPVDSPGQRVWRLRRRRRYDGFNFLLEMVGAEDDAIGSVVLESESFAEFASTLGVRMQEVADVEAELAAGGFTHVGGAMDDPAIAMRRGCGRIGHVARRTDGVLAWSGDYVAVVQEQYIEFRSALLGEQFS